MKNIRFSHTLAQIDEDIRQHEQGIARLKAARKHLAESTTLLFEVHIPPHHPQDTTIMVSDSDLVVACRKASRLDMEYNGQRSCFELFVSCGDIRIPILPEEAYRLLSTKLSSHNFTFTLDKRFLDSKLGGIVCKVGKEPVAGYPTWPTPERQLPERELVQT